MTGTEPDKDKLIAKLMKVIAMLHKQNMDLKRRL